MSFEANPKYRESVLEDLGLEEDSMSLTSPGTKEADRDDDSLPKVLGDDRKYRSIVATINYLHGYARSAVRVSGSMPRDVCANVSQRHRLVPFAP